MPDDQVSVPEPASTELTPEPVVPPVPATEPEIAQPEGTNGSNTPSEPITPEAIPAPEPPPLEVPIATPLPTPVPSSNQIVRDLAAKARAVIQDRKRKKLDKVMTLFNTKPQISNKDVEKLLRCSDATATRYLSILEKEGRITQVGKHGRGVLYIKV